MKYEIIKTGVFLTVLSRFLKSFIKFVNKRAGKANEINPDLPEQVEFVARRKFLENIVKLI